jgi:dipeptidyl aminopeptidase/acylaminoacyl peptidase
MKKKHLVVLFCLFGSLSAFAQNKMAPETLWQMGRVSEPLSAPDGKLVVYSVTRFNIQANKGNADLFVVPVIGGEAKQITNSFSSESNARWRPDGKKIGYIGMETGTPQLWEINPDGSDNKQITNFKNGVTNFNYSPKGNMIYFTQDIKIHETLADRYPDLPKANALKYDGLMMRHWNQWEDEHFSHIMVSTYNDGKVAPARDIMPNEPYDAPNGPFGGEEEINWSPDGKFIAYSCKKEEGTAYATSTNTDIYIFDLATGKTENISSDNKGYDTQPRFSPDGKSIAWLSMERAGFEADKNRIVVLDLATKTLNEITKDLDQSADEMIWSPDSKTIYFASCTNAVHQLYAYAINAKTANLVKITNGLTDMGAISLATDAKSTYLIATKTSLSRPAEIVKVDVLKGKMETLTTTNDALYAGLKLGKVEKRLISTSDNKEMLTWVIYPPDFDPKKKYPTLLYCQGGPQSTISQSFSFRWNFQLMAANGYIIVAPNRRGLPSFGQEWNDQISGDWGGQAMRDYLAAIDELSKEPFVDTARRGAVGASYGGYSVYYLAGHHNGRFKTFIAHCGVFNLESMYGATEEVFFSNFDMEGPYWKSPQPKSYEQFSPHKFVQNWNTPILVIHNEKDFRVPLGEGLQAFNAAQLKGIKSRFLYFADEGHWVSKPQNSLLWQREFFRWLKETL